MKSLGQYFLKNKIVANKIVAAIDAGAEDIIIEVGPGRGALTIPLLEAAEKIGARLIVVEKDKNLAEKLPEQLSKQLPERLHEKLTPENIIAEDVLLFLESEQFKAEIRGTKSYKLVGNLPYYITGHLLRIMSELEIKPVSCVFMVQQEVAERIIALPPKMNRLAASVQFWAEAEIIARVPKTDFSPQPDVSSAVIRLTTKKTASLLRADSNADAATARYYAAVRAIFAQPRKTILNNLASSGKMEKEDALKLLESLQLDPKSRPQDLTIAKIEAIAEKYPR